MDSFKRIFVGDLRHENNSHGNPSFRQHSHWGPLRHTIVAQAAGTGTGQTRYRPFVAAPAHPEGWLRRFSFEVTSN
jgi:hypothetical protein